MSRFYIQPLSFKATPGPVQPSGAPIPPFPGSDGQSIPDETPVRDRCTPLSPPPLGERGSTTIVPNSIGPTHGHLARANHPGGARCGTGPRLRRDARNGVERRRVEWNSPRGKVAENRERGPGRLRHHPRRQSHSFISRSRLLIGR